jgi:hypothetical protein
MLCTSEHAPMTEDPRYLVVDRASASSDEIPPIATIILPAYNESEALPQVLTDLFAVLDARHEVIVVDDGSVDDTPVIARRYPCRLIRQQNQGKGAAVRTGLRAARGQYIILMDADNTYPATAIPHMIELLDHHDFVRGIRKANQDNMPLINWVGNRVFDSVLDLMHGLEGDDHMTGLYGLRREVFESLQFESDGFDMEVEIGIKAQARRLRIAAFPIEYRERLGEKKLNALQDGWRILRRILSMAFIYNAGLTFVLPGMLLWSLAALMTMMIGAGSVVTPYAVLGLHTFIVGALAATVGFQLIVFGIVAALYATEHGVPAKPWLSMLSKRNVLIGVGIFGMLCALLGVGAITVMGVQWLAGGGGAFDDTRGIVMAGTLVSWGMQMMLAALFVSIFLSRAAWARPPKKKSSPAVIHDLVHIER